MSSLFGSPCPMTHEKEGRRIVFASSVHDRTYELIYTLIGVTGLHYLYPRLFETCNWCTLWDDLRILKASLIVGYNWSYTACVKAHKTNQPSYACGAALAFYTFPRYSQFADSANPVIYLQILLVMLVKV
ncbi:hypothetical protein A0H81_01428 [Grifola frondosa]|uniref:Uncharacterized protein n=1 Tax=Grifola frondosa TaxID=5627 RepID=A0A1C7MQK6_GRIFR|nr:hypothetical protein A0H81_01428 [Grifola frondosa]